MIAGVANALAARANTITLPERMPGIASGTMTRRRTAARPAPSDTAARSTAGSMRCNEAQTEITTNGTSTCVSATMTPMLAYMNCTGSTMPSSASPLLTRPVEPNSSAQPSVRTTTDISSGPSTIIRNRPFQGFAMRFSTIASKVPRIAHAAVTTSAIQNVRPKISQ